MQPQKRGLRSSKLFNNYWSVIMEWPVVGTEEDVTDSRTVFYSWLSREMFQRSSGLFPLRLRVALRGER